MRLILTVLLTCCVASTAYAASQKECEALMKPVNAKLEGVQRLDKPTPKACAQSGEAIKAYVEYQAQADKLNCPFAYVSGQKIGGAAERADLINDMKAAYKEKCR